MQYIPNVLPAQNSIFRRITCTMQYYIISYCRQQLHTGGLISEITRIETNDAFSYQNYLVAVARQLIFILLTKILPNCIYSNKTKQFNLARQTFFFLTSLKLNKLYLINFLKNLMARVVLRSFIEVSEFA